MGRVETPLKFGRSPSRSFGGLVGLTDGDAEIGEVLFVPRTSQGTRQGLRHVRGFGGMQPDLVASGLLILLDQFCEDAEDSEYLEDRSF